MHSDLFYCNIEEPSAIVKEGVHMIQEMNEQLDRYWDWLRDKTSLQEMGDRIEITTPYLDRHNDCLQIYAKKDNGSLLLTDDGYTCDDLEQSGCSLDSPKRQAILRTMLNGFGVTLEGNALQVRTSTTNFPLCKHNLVQAMLAVNDLFLLASPSIASLFLEDVASWLELSGARYTPNVKFSGKSGLDHRFDLVIPKSPTEPERMVRTVNRPNRDMAQIIAFSWIDIREDRESDASAYVMLNDSEQSIPGGIADTMRSYGLNAVPWSARDHVQERLAA